MKSIIFIFFLLLNNSFVLSKSNKAFRDFVPMSYMTESSFIQDFYEYIDTDSIGNATEMQLFFKNLKTYSPYNSYGSCGFVSYIQYLSYLDSYFNDDIIQETYDRNSGNQVSLSAAKSNSPGVLRQSLPNGSSVTQLNKYNFIQNSKSYDYQSYLIDYYNYFWDNDVNNYQFSIGMWDYFILNSYNNVLDVASFQFYSYSIFGHFEDVIDYTTVTWFDNYVKSNLDNDIPVILHIGKLVNNELTQLHSVIAYYYDAEGIHAHFGWDINTTDTIIKDDYYIYAAGIFDIDSITESHSNNFIVNNHFYCGCEYLDSTSHNYNDHYQGFNNSKHKSFCSCGDYILEDHVVSSGGFLPFAFNIGRCSICNQLVDLSIHYE